MDVFAPCCQSREMPASYQGLFSHFLATFIFRIEGGARYFRWTTTEVKWSIFALKLCIYCAWRRCGTCACWVTFAVNVETTRAIFYLRWWCDIFKNCRNASARRKSHVQPPSCKWCYGDNWKNRRKTNKQNKTKNERKRNSMSWISRDKITDFGTPAATNARQRCDNFSPPRKIYKETVYEKFYQYILAIFKNCLTVIYWITFEHLQKPRVSQKKRINHLIIPNDLHLLKILGVANPHDT